jgi:hypothetical protein
MLPDEKDKLLALFDGQERWCQGAEARDARGEAVCYSDPAAAAWDLTGGVCLLFGWRRASALFQQLARHILGRRDRQPARSPEIESMAALQDYNDRTDTTYAMVREQLEAMPVWKGKSATR